MSQRSFTLAVAVSAAVSLAGWHTRAQAPTFRGGVDRVVVDFLAVDGDGRPVPDLKLVEMTLKVDGKPRAIRSVEFLRLAPAGVTLTSSLPPAKAVPAPFGSNAPAEAGRAIILVFHHTSLAPGDERPAREAAVVFINTLTPRDRLALVTFQEGRVEVDLTTDHARVLKVLPSITGHSGNDERHAVRNLISLLNSFAAIDGPKTVVFISGAMPALSRDTLFDYQDLGKAAAKTGVHLFIIKPHGLGAMGVTTNHGTFDANGMPNNGPTSAVGTGLEQLAGVTGGAFFQLSAGATRVFERVNLESSAYYLLGFDADASERNGKSHKIALAVARPDVTIRARPEFVIAKSDPAPKGAAAAPRHQAMLGDLAAHRDLPLRVVAYAFGPSGPGRVGVLVVAESAAPTRITSAAFALVDDKGRIAAQWDANAKDLAASPVVSSAIVPPGSYRVRVAAADADGRQGAVDYEFSATLTRAGPLTVGGLMLGHMRGQKFAPQLEFGAEPSATAYLEIYGQLPGSGLPTVTMELAATADGPAITRVPARLAPNKDADRLIATADLPLAELRPGDLVVRAIVSDDGATGIVIRTLRKRPQ